MIADVVQQLLCCNFIVCAAVFVTVAQAWNEGVGFNSAAAVAWPWQVIRDCGTDDL